MTRRDARAGEDPGRVAVTVVYQAARETGSERIFVPDRYADRLGAFASSLSLRRVFAAGGRLTGDSDLDMCRDEARSLMRIVVRRAGSDLTREVSRQSNAFGTGLVHVDLNMSDNGTNEAAEALRSLGFVYGAWLPGWSGSDVLRMQLIRTPTARELSPTLYTREAEDLLASIHEELREVSDPGVVG
jgi:hypothetical protein